MCKILIITLVGLCAVSAFGYGGLRLGGPRPGPGGPPGSWGPPPPGSWGPPPTGPKPNCACPPSAESITEATNTAIMKDFNKIAFTDKNVIGAADKYMDANIIEHNSLGLDGIDDFKKTMTYLTTNSPGQVMDTKRYVAQGDLVFIHGRTSWLGEDVAFVDIYRLKNGKIVEHWDVIQRIPATSKNPHAFF